ncbi:CotH kinase family protein [Planctomycetota bacterium]
MKNRILSLIAIILFQLPVPECKQSLLVAQDQLVISEFLAINSGNSSLDCDGESSDWVEIYNSDGNAINMVGWCLTDNPNKLNKWEFPAISLESDQHILVFASGKDRSDIGSELHTNFRLSAKGEFLALVHPDKQTIAHSYVYTQQYANVSYGRAWDIAAQLSETKLISEYADATALVPMDGSLGLDWTDPEFDDSHWKHGKTGIGYAYNSLMNLDVSAMRNRNPSVYIRIPFDIIDVSIIDRLILRMKYEDGFVAFLNGQRVVSANAPISDQLQWNSVATANWPDEQAVIFQDFDISLYKDLILSGRNILALQGLNVTLSSSDLLVLPVLVATKTGTIPIDQVIDGYFLEPTPSAPNTGALFQLGPIIHTVTHTPQHPMQDEDIVVTAKLEPMFEPVAQVQLIGRLNYSSEESFFPVGMTMTDDGTDADAIAGDHIYSAAIPSTLFYPGAMVRWSVRAMDQEGRSSRNPLFPLQENSPAFYGTVIQDPLMTSELPILYWFSENPEAAGTRSGTRASAFFNGEFYDNIFVRQRGGATVGSGSKKFVFNKGHKFRLSDDLDGIEEFNYNENGYDPTYLRQALAFETHHRAGCPSSICFPMVSILNGKPERTGVFVEQVDEEFLERNDLDPRGALYKFTQRSQITPVFSDISTGIEKKTRQYEDFSDIGAIVEGLNAPTEEQRKRFVFDNFNLPFMLNYLVARCLIQDTDDIRKNFYFYCDTEGTGEWSIFPWDKDWTFGVVGDGGICTSHPFLGDAAHPKTNGLQWSVYLDVMYNLTETREMFLRRLRTVMDQLLQPNGMLVAEGFFEKRIDQLFASAKNDLGNISGSVNYFKAYFPKRRTQLYIDHNVNNASSTPTGGNAGIPDAQPNNVLIEFGHYEASPVSNKQDEEYIELINSNNYAVDISGWKLAGGIKYEFLPGTVIPAHGNLYVSPDVRVFRRRTTSPTGGEGYFVQGDYKGHLSSHGETIDLLNVREEQVSTLTYSREFK